MSLSALLMSVSLFSLSQYDGGKRIGATKSSAPCFCLYSAMIFFILLLKRSEKHESTWAHQYYDPRKEIRNLSPSQKQQNNQMQVVFNFAPSVVSMKAK